MFPLQLQIQPMLDTFALFVSTTGVYHCRDVKWASRHLNSLSTRLSAVCWEREWKHQSHPYWPLVTKFTGGFPHNRPVTRKVFPCHKIIMIHWSIYTCPPCTYSCQACSGVIASYHISMWSKALLHRPTYCPQLWNLWSRRRQHVYEDQLLECP